MHSTLRGWWADLQRLFGFPVGCAGFLRDIGVIVDEDVAEVVVVVHGPDFDGNSTHLADAGQGVLVQEVSGVGDLLGGPRALKRTARGHGSCTMILPISM
jgi:hypothetical protein